MVYQCLLMRNQEYTTAVLRIRDVYPGSRIPDPGSQIPDPDFYPSRIPDLGSRIQKQKQKRGTPLFCFCFQLSYLFCSHKFHKIEHYLIFEILKKKICANFQRIRECFTQKIVNMLSQIWLWDPGSRIRGQKGTGSRIPDMDPGSPIQIRNTVHK